MFPCVFNKIIDNQQVFYVFNLLSNRNQIGWCFTYNATSQRYVYEQVVISGDLNDFYQSRATAAIVRLKSNTRSTDRTVLDGNMSTIACNQLPPDFHYDSLGRYASFEKGSCINTPLSDGQTIISYPYWQPFRTTNYNKHTAFLEHQEPLIVTTVERTAFTGDNYTIEYPYESAYQRIGSMSLVFDTIGYDGLTEPDTYHFSLTYQSFGNEGYIGVTHETTELTVTSNSEFFFDIMQSEAYTLKSITVTTAGLGYGFSLTIRSYDPILAPSPIIKHFMSVQGSTGTKNLAGSGSAMFELLPYAKNYSQVSMRYGPGFSPAQIDVFRSMLSDPNSNLRLVYQGNGFEQFIRQMLGESDQEEAQARIMEQQTHQASVLSLLGNAWKKGVSKLKQWGINPASYIRRAVDLAERNGYASYYPNAATHYASTTQPLMPIFGFKAKTKAQAEQQKKSRTINRTTSLPTAPPPTNVHFASIDIPKYIADRRGSYPDAAQLRANGRNYFISPVELICYLETGMLPATYEDATKFKHEKILAGKLSDPDALEIADQLDFSSLSLGNAAPFDKSYFIYMDEGNFDFPESMISQGEYTKYLKALQELPENKPPSSQPPAPPQKDTQQSAFPQFGFKAKTKEEAKLDEKAVKFSEPSALIAADIENSLPLQMAYSASAFATQTNLMKYRRYSAFVLIAKDKSPSLCTLEWSIEPRNVPYITVEAFFKEWKTPKWAKSVYLDQRLVNSIQEGKSEFVALYAIFNDPRLVSITPPRDENGDRLIKIYITAHCHSSVQGISGTSWYGAFYALLFGRDPSIIFEIAVFAMALNEKSAPFVSIQAVGDQKIKLSYIYSLGKKPEKPALIQALQNLNMRPIPAFLATQEVGTFCEENKIYADDMVTIFNQQEVKNPQILLLDSFWQQAYNYRSPDAMTYWQRLSAAGFAPRLALGGNLVQGKPESDKETLPKPTVEEVIAIMKESDDPSMQLGYGLIKSRNDAKRVLQEFIDQLPVSSKGYPEDLFRGFKSYYIGKDGPGKQYQTNTFTITNPLNPEEKKDVKETRVVKGAVNRTTKRRTMRPSKEVTDLAKNKNAIRW